MTRQGRAVLVRAAAMGVAALAIGVTIRRGRWEAADAQLFRAINGTHEPVRDALLRWVTELGSLWAAVGAAAALAGVGYRRAAARGLGAAAATWVAGQVLKRAFDRPRPYHAHPATTHRRIAPPQGRSWPSSHPAVLTAFCATATRELGAAPAVRLGTHALSAAVAYSRVYLGVHYPSDVVAGLLLGRAIGIAWPGIS